MLALIPAQEPHAENALATAAHVETTSPIAIKAVLNFSRDSFLSSPVSLWPLGQGGISAPLIPLVSWAPSSSLLAAWAGVEPSLCVIPSCRFSVSDIRFPH